MRSISVPCGTSSTSSSPASIFFCVSGFSPMWLTIALASAPALTSLPIPTPGSAVSLAITVSRRLPCRTISSTIRSGVPTPMKPPIIRLAPSGIFATASATLVVRIEPPLLGEPRPVDRQRRTADLRGGVRTQEHDQRTDRLGGHELVRRLLLGEKRDARLVHRDAVARRAVVD